MNVSEEVVERLDALTSAGTAMPGTTLSRADVHRAALLEGLKVLEAKFAAQGGRGSGHGSKR